MSLHQSILGIQPSQMASLMASWSGQCAASLTGLINPYVLQHLRENEFLSASQINKIKTIHYCMIDCDWQVSRLNHGWWEALTNHRSFHMTMLTTSFTMLPTSTNSLADDCSVLLDIRDNLMKPLSKKWVWRYCSLQTNRPNVVVFDLCFVDTKSWSTIGR